MNDKKITPNRRKVLQLLGVGIGASPIASNVKAKSTTSQSDRTVKYEDLSEDAQSLFLKYLNNSENGYYHKFPYELKANDYLVYKGEKYSLNLETVKEASWKLAPKAIQEKELPVQKPPIKKPQLPKKAQSALSEAITKGSIETKEDLPTSLKKSRFVSIGGDTYETNIWTSDKAKFRISPQKESA